MLFTFYWLKILFWYFPFLLRYVVKLARRRRQIKSLFLFLFHLSQQFEFGRARMFHIIGVSVHFRRFEGSSINLKKKKTEKCWSTVITNSRIWIPFFLRKMTYLKSSYENVSPFLYMNFASKNLFKKVIVFLTEM